MVGADEGQRALAVRGLPDEREVRLALDEGPQAHPDELVVVGQRDGDHRRPPPVAGGRGHHGGDRVAPAGRGPATGPRRPGAAARRGRARPEPGVPGRGSAAGGVPTSVTVTRSRSPSRSTVTCAGAAPAWWMTLDRDSCTTRTTASSRARPAPTARTAGSTASSTGSPARPARSTTSASCPGRSSGPRGGEPAPSGGAPKTSREARSSVSAAPLAARIAAREVPGLRRLVVQGQQRDVGLEGDEGEAVAGDVVDLAGQPHPLGGDRVGHRLVPVRPLGSGPEAQQRAQRPGQQQPARRPRGDEDRGNRGAVLHPRPDRRRHDDHRDRDGTGGAAQRHRGAGADQRGEQAELDRPVGVARGQVDRGGAHHPGQGGDRRARRPEQREGGAGGEPQPGRVELAGGVLQALGHEGAHDDDADGHDREGGPASAVHRGGHGPRLGTRRPVGVSIWT